MAFNHYLDALKFQLQQDLPGEVAQNQMSRFGREQYDKQVAQLAAVLVLIFPKNDELNLILTKRTSHRSSDKHSGQISFPGGSKDQQDLDLSITALRETHEEIGIAPETIHLMGKLTQLYIPVSKFLVQPFIGFSPHISSYHLQQEEVDQLIEVPLTMLLDESTQKQKDLKVQNGQIFKDVPYFNIYGHVVWGATAMILSEFKAILNRIQVK